MITRKHLFFAIAATCLLTTFLFGVVPIRSAGYDPTLDVNHDGKIDGKDIALPASAYGTAGDPTVPVNVTNWPTYTLQTGIVNISSSGNDIPSVNCSGYSRLSLMIGGNTNASLGAGNNITIIAHFIEWLYNPYDPCYAWERLSGDLNITIYNGIHQLSGGFPFACMTEIKAPLCYLNFEWSYISLPANWWVTFEYVVYLRNE
jgi:hypothetical protein